MMPIHSILVLLKLQSDSIRLTLAAGHDSLTGIVHNHIHMIHGIQLLVIIPVTYSIQVISDYTSNRDEPVTQTLISHAH